MSRRRAAEKREVLPDAKFGDVVVSKFMNSVMLDGKKSAAERIVYGAFDLIASRGGNDPVKMFHEALENVKPQIEVRSRRVGGATYQVPVDVRAGRAQALAFRLGADQSILSGILRFSLTPQPWSVETHYSFLYVPAIRHWLLFIPMLLACQHMWLRAPTAALWWVPTSCSPRRGF